MMHPDSLAAKLAAIPNIVPDFLSQMNIELFPCICRQVIYMILGAAPCFSVGIPCSFDRKSFGFTVNSYMRMDRHFRCSHPADNTLCTARSGTDQVIFFSTVI